MKTASWVIKNKLTAEIITEIYDEKKVNALNVNKYVAVPIQEHLAGLSVPSIATLEDRYIEAASKLHSKQAQLDNYEDALSVYIDIRDGLKGHPEFTGRLPRTFYSGGDLDPLGCDESKHLTSIPRN